METFKVTSPFDKADFIRVNKIKWKILSVKARKQLIGIIITTIILLFLAIIEKNNGGSDDTFETFGFIFLLLTFWLFIFRHFQKLNYSLLWFVLKPLVVLHLTLENYPKSRN